ncbi:MAG: CoA ester lyase, partial [Pseudomonadota bacterium]
QLWVRVNPLTTPDFARDLKAFDGVRPAGIVLPKTRNGDDVRAADEAITGALGTGSACPLLAIATEVPISVLSLATYIDCSANLIGLTWGAEDLSAELGATTSRDGHGNLTSPFQLARDLCLMTAAAAGLAAVDSVFTDFRDHDALAAECTAAARDGFTAKMAIHPAQVDVINRAFSPSEDDLEKARRIIAAFETADSGVASLDGQMLDRPHLARARQTLARAKPAS